MLPYRVIGSLTNPISSCWLMFSRAPGILLVVVILSFDWYLALFPLFWSAVVITLVVITLVVIDDIDSKSVVCEKISAALKLLFECSYSRLNHQTLRLLKSEVRFPFGADDLRTIIHYYKFFIFFLYTFYHENSPSSLNENSPSFRIIWLDNCPFNVSLLLVISDEILMQSSSLCVPPLISSKY